jgi:superfamily II DNA helicase RecQ
MGGACGSSPPMRSGGYCEQRDLGPWGLEIFFENRVIMQIRIFTIPIMGGEQLVEEMNVFLRSKKVLQLKEHLVNHDTEGVHWCYSVRYVDDVSAAEREKVKVDYREILNEAAFKRFSSLREIRKKVAQDDAVPAYAVFTDGELAELAKMESITLESIKTLKGVGEKKIEKYGHHFITKPSDEKRQ